MILDGGVVADVIVAPDDDVVSDADEGLDVRVFEDETIFADFVVAGDRF